KYSQAISPPAEDQAATVEVPLPEFTRVRDRVKALREERARALGPPVVLGAADYRGEARPGALALTLTLQASLGWPGRFKMVPLVGDDVVVVRASDGREPLTLSRQAGYHVWVTRRSGEVTVKLDLLVPARGPRGSIEFDFLVARTPVTRFVCRFPVAGLEPRIDTAVHSELSSTGNSTTLTATLAPTTRVHLVGYRELADEPGRKAKIYAETLNLLSLDQGAADVFTVIRYTILYGGVREFLVRLPEDVKVVSADGEGAFRWEVDKDVLRGETAYPIRNSYEISLRLHREIGKDKVSLLAPLPRALGVERETGFLAVEAPGKLQLAEEERHEALAIDVRQLPGEMVESAVSPILRAYRYHTAEARVRLGVTRLPEQEPASASVDRVKAVSVVSTDGKVLTDVRITLRNRLRPVLRLTLAPGVDVRSTLLDGEPVKPSREGEVLVLPLKRSAGGDFPEPFTLQVVLDSAVSALGLAGAPQLALPAVDLPVSSLAWTLYVPARNVYSRPRGDVEPQSLWGTAGWHQARRAAPVQQTLARDEAAVSGGSGEMPVRIKIPETGARLEYARYWIDAGQPVEVSVWYLRGWLMRPLGLLLAALMAFGVLMAMRGVAYGRLPAPWPGIGLAAIAAWPLYKVAGSALLVLAVLAGAGVAWWQSGGLSRAWAGASEWFASLGKRFKKRTKEAFSWKRLIARLALGAGFLVVGILLLVSVLGLLALLANPLAG
ncbi:MAG: hypothetical protein HYZ27_04875, partial [Deltaproteobacteria bacterium]|nr:hypothetical protein [Deltaproteobacteria bacterium]